MESRKIVAVFDTHAAAQAAAGGLLQLGVQREQVSIADQSSSEFSTQNQSGERAGFWAHIKEMFMPDEDRTTLEESVRRGGYVLSATVNDELADAAIQSLERDGAIDLEQRAAEWRAAGWQQPIAAQPASAEVAPEAAGDKPIPVVEERVRVGKREVNRGSVRVRSYIVETPVHEEVRLREERVEVERRPVNEPPRPVMQGSPEDLLQERTIELTETAEEAVVGKEALVTEEVRVRKTTGERVEQIEDTVRHTEVEVDDDRPAAPQARPKSNPTRPKRV
jgi:uncharacterized protein (TIGR02271 family)